jgi:hypothetical protein
LDDRTWRLSHGHDSDFPAMQNVLRSARRNDRSCVTAVARRERRRRRGALELARQGLPGGRKDRAPGGAGFRAAGFPGRAIGLKLAEHRPDRPPGNVGFSSSPRQNTHSLRLRAESPRDPARSPPHARGDGPGVARDASCARSSTVVLRCGISPMRNGRTAFLDATTASNCRVELETPL